jgi:outer membrane protein TolC
VSAARSAHRRRLRPGSSLLLGIACALSAPARAASPLTFDQAIARILARSTSVPAQQAQLDAARARALPSYFSFAPGLSVDAKRTWTGGVAPEAPYHTAEAVADLNLFRFGADFAGLQAGRADGRAQEAQLQNAILLAEEEAVRAIALYLERKHSTEISEKFVGSQADLLRIARERYKAGYLPQQEVDKVSIDLENEKSRLADAQVLEAQAEAALVALLDDANIELAWPWKDSLAGRDGKALAAAAFALDARPDWQAALSSTSAEDARSWRGHLLLLPSVDAAFAFGNTMAVTNGGDELAGGPAWRATLGVTWTLWDHAATYSAARAQASAAAQAGLRQERLARDARGDWRAAKAAFEIAVDSAVSRQRSAEVARKLYEDNLRRFQKGRASANELSVDQTRLFQNELFAVQGWSAAHQAFSRLCHSLGRRLQDCRPSKS